MLPKNDQQGLTFRTSRVEYGMAKKIHNKQFRIVKGGDSLYTQKYVALYRLRRDGKIVDGFYGVGFMLNKARKLRRPFVQVHVTNDLECAYKYALRHARAWSLDRIKIEPEVQIELEKSENWDTIRQSIEKPTPTGD